MPQGTRPPPRREAPSVRFTLVSQAESDRADGHKNTARLFPTCCQETWAATRNSCQRPGHVQCKRPRGTACSHPHNCAWLCPIGAGCSCRRSPWPWSWRPINPAGQGGQNGDDGDDNEGLDKGNSWSRPWASLMMPFHENTDYGCNGHLKPQCSRFYDCFHNDIHSKPPNAADEP